MSDMGTNNISSLLPEDVEAKLAKVQETISILEGKVLSTSNELEEKKSQLALVNSQLSDATLSYQRKLSESEEITKNLNAQTDGINRRASDLNVYAVALEEKEKRINKYLHIFERMKDIADR